MTDFTISIDILESVQDFYPGLPAFQAEIIAEKIIDKWDYTGEYNKIADDISWYANALDIDLKGKEGVYE